MADVFPLRKHVPIGVDTQGKPILPSTDFIKQWEELFRRVGQYTALTNIELEQLGSSSQLGVFSRPSQRQKSITGSTYVDVSSDAGGYTLTLNLSDVIDQARAAIVPFISRQSSNKQRADSAEFVIAQRVFGAR